MPKYNRVPILTLAAVSLVAPLPQMASAQAPVGALVTLVMPAGQFGSEQFTDLLVGSLGAARNFCGALEKSYQADCLAERIGNLADEIPADSDYGEIREVLEETSREISQLARANRDPALPRQNASSGGSTPQATTRPLTPVSADQLASVNQQAAAILERTETLLLRSPDDESGKKLHYTRIAQAIGSNKTLLRSA